MTDKEVILLFKKEYGMSEKAWKNFCKHYAKRDVETPLAYIKKICNNNGLIFTNRFKKFFQNEIISEASSGLCIANK